MNLSRRLSARPVLVVMERSRSTGEPNRIALTVLDVGIVVVSLPRISKNEATRLPTMSHMSGAALHAAAVAPVLTVRVR